MIKWILGLILFFSKQIDAVADPRQDFTRDHSSKQELLDQKYLVRTVDGVQIFSRKPPSFPDNGDTILFKPNSFVAEHTKANNGEWLEYTELDQSGKVIGKTFCGTSYTDKQKLGCRGLTSEYCKELTKKLDSGVFRSDIKKLKECSTIANHLMLMKDYGTSQTQLKGVEFFKKTFSVELGRFKHDEPDSLSGIIKEYSDCESLKSKWQESNTQWVRSSKKGSTAD